jgi:hypothetical protein
VFAICKVSVSPLRAAPSHKSEMVSQLLFGEVVEVLDRQREKWWRVRCVWDDYLGWVSSLQLTPVAADVVEACTTDFARSLEIVQPAVRQDHFLPLPLGALLPMHDGLTFRFPEKTYQFSGQTVHPDQVEVTPDLVIRFARKYLYAPYLWGGRSPLGIDCSGLIQMVFLLAGIQLPRDASQQIDCGHPVDFAANMAPADLAFFEDPQGRITHVGIVLGDAQILHASGFVRIDRIDHYGIFSVREQRYTHTLRVIKRILT